MANNEYVNKVVYGDTTVMDITDTTATAADVVSGHDFYLKTGQKVSGSIQTKSSSDLTASGNTVTVPVGYYASQASKAVSSGSATPATTISGSSASISTGTNTITLSKTVSNVPVVSAGYISTGSTGNSDVSLTASVSVNPAPTASGKTVTTPAGYYTTSTTTDVATGSATPAASISGTSATISTGTNTITLSKTVSNTPVVSAGYISSGTAGNSDVSLTASVTVNPTPTASGATVTIPAGYYSAQTTKSVDSGSLSKGAGSSSATGTNVTLGSKTTGTPTLPYITVTGSGAVSVGTAGYLAANTSETSNSETANYSVTAINVPKDIAFTVTSTADTAYDTSSKITLKNSAYRRAIIENSGYVRIYTPYNQASADSNTDVEITNAGSGQNNVTVTNLNDYYVTVNSYDQNNNYSSQYISQGGYTYWTAQSYNVYDADLYVSAYNSSNTLEANKQVVAQGRWNQRAVTPSTSSQGPYYGRVTVNAVPTMTLPTAASSTSSGTSKAIITPGTSTQYLNIPTGYNGAVAYYTISGDADLVASNIISTANIFGVQGSVVINKYYTGSSAPSSSLGSNGDIYLQS